MCFMCAHVSVTHIQLTCWQGGQNHSPSGINMSGGRRQAVWYPLSQESHSRIWGHTHETYIQWNNTVTTLHSQRQGWYKPQCHHINLKQTTKPLKGFRILFLLASSDMAVLITDLLFKSFMKETIPDWSVKYCFHCSLTSLGSATCNGNLPLLLPF